MEAAAATAPPTRHWRLARASGLGIVLLLAGFQLVPQTLNPGLLLAAQAAGTSTLLTLVSVLWAALGTRPVVERLGLGPGRAGIGLVLLLALGLLGLSHAVDRLIHLLDLRSASHLARLDAAIGGDLERSWTWILLGLGLFPGFGEEIFFRGCVQRGLHRWLGRLGAIVLTSLFFGAFHGDWVHGVGAFFLGLYLGTVAELCGGTRPAIACHVLNNLGAVGGMALPLVPDLRPELLAALGIGLAALALGVAAAWLRVAPDLQGAPPAADP